MDRIHFLSGLCSVCVAALAVLPACDPSQTQEQDTPTMDVHSFARPTEAVVRHLDLNLNVNFGNHIISGPAAWEIETPEYAGEILFDPQGLKIKPITQGAGRQA